MSPVSIREFIKREKNNSKYRGQLVVRDKNTEIISFKLLEAIFNLVNAKNVKCMNVTDRQVRQGQIYCLSSLGLISNYHKIDSNRLNVHI